MYIHFNKSGQVSTVLNHGEIPRQGGNYSLNFLFDLDYLNPNNCHLEVIFTSPSGRVSTTHDIEEFKRIVFRKLNSSENTFSLKDGTEYYMATIRVDNTIPQAFESAGNITASVKVAESNGNIKAQGNVTYFLEKTATPVTGGITLNQYNEIMAAFNAAKTQIVDLGDFTDILEAAGEAINSGAKSATLRLDQYAAFAIVNKADNEVLIYTLSEEDKSIRVYFCYCEFENDLLSKENSYYIDATTFGKDELVENVNIDIDLVNSENIAQTLENNNIFRNCIINRRYYITHSRLMISGKGVRHTYFITDFKTHKNYLCSINPRYPNPDAPKSYSNKEISYYSVEELTELLSKKADLVDGKVPLEQLDTKETGELLVGTSINYDTTRDDQIPTTKAVDKIVNELDNKKADKLNTYTKTEVDNKEYNLNRRIDDTYMELESMVEESRNEIEDRENLISIIGNATESLAGVMSAEDKKNLNTLVALLQDDENNIVDTINEVLAIFDQYPEGADLVSALSGKADKADTYSKSQIDSFNSEKVDKTTYESKVEELEENISDLDNIKIEIDSLLAKNNIKNYQEVLWLGSDEIPEIPTQLPFGSSTDLITFLEGLKTLWSDINSNLIEQYGYDRVVFLGYVNSIKKMVKCTIRYQELSGTYALLVHSSIYKANVKECISLNTNKRYKLINDTYETPQEPSYFLEEISGYSKSEVDNLLANLDAGVSEEDVMNIIEENAEQTDTLDIGTSETFDETSDEQVPTSKAVSDFVASAGGGKLYEHIISFRNGNISTNWVRTKILSYDNTPYTEETLKQYLFENHNTAYTGLISSGGIEPSNENDYFIVPVSFSLFKTTESFIKINYEYYLYKYDSENNVFTSNKKYVYNNQKSILNIYDFTDTVTEL